MDVNQAGGAQGGEEDDGGAFGQVQGLAEAVEGMGFGGQNGADFKVADGGGQQGGEVGRPEGIEKRCGIELRDFLHVFSI